jgi:peptidoglycan L-alanyl-D-glutamate endopeptidase CwlK
MIELTEKQKERTRRNLVGVHPHLVQVVERASEISPVPFVVTEGLRTLDRQRQLKKAGKSWTLNSRHLTGHAVDVVDADDFKYDIPDMTKIKEAMFSAAEELKIPLVWGGDWKQRDTPHF